MTKSQNRGKGFAGMDPERQREIARMGGKSVPADRRSFAQDRQLAETAGRKGGQQTGARIRATDFGPGARKDR